MLHLSKQVFKFITMWEFQNTKMIFGEGYDCNWTKEIFVLIEVQNTILWAHVINFLIADVAKSTLHERNLQKLKKAGLREVYYWEKDWDNFE